MKRGLDGFWLVVAAGAAILAINMGIRQTFGLYVVPVSRDLGLGREVFSLAIALLNLIWGAAAPFAGAVTDSIGPARVILAGAFCYILGICLMAVAPGETALVASGVLIGLGVAGTGFSAVLGPVGRAAPEEKRQLALSIATMGSAIGQFVALPYAHVLMDAQGWVISLFALAVTAAFMAPLGLSLPGKQTDGTLDTSQTLSEALREASRHTGFWLLTVGFFVCGFHIAVVAVHLPAYLGDKGFSPQLAVVALMIVGLANIVGTYLCGLAGDLMEKRQALALVYFGRAVLFVGFLYMPLTQMNVLIFAGLLGLLWLGTIPLTSGLIVTFFGPRWLSMLYGIVFFSHQIGSFLGAWMGGVIYDNFKSYELMWWLCVALGIVAAMLNWPIREVASPRLQMAK